MTQERTPEQYHQLFSDIRSKLIIPTPQEEAPYLVLEPFRPVVQTAFEHLYTDNISDDFVSILGEGGDHRLYRCGGSSNDYLALRLSKKLPYIIEKTQGGWRSTQGFKLEEELQAFEQAWMDKKNVAPVGIVALAMDPNKDVRSAGILTIDLTQGGRRIITPHNLGGRKGNCRERIRVYERNDDKEYQLFFVDPFYQIARWDDEDKVSPFLQDEMIIDLSPKHKVPEEPMEKYKNIAKGFRRKAIEAAKKKN